MSMWTPDPQVQEQIREHVGFEAPTTADDRRDPEDAIHTLWAQWTDLTYALQEFGVPPKHMCDSSNAIASAREEIRQREGSRS
jgi:hypothetical protein